jgi:hypothetical protein
MVYCEISHKEGWTKGTKGNAWSFGRVFCPNVIEIYLENQFTHHKVCDSDHERRLEARVQALPNPSTKTSPVKCRPCDVSKEIWFLKLGNAYGIDGIPNKCLSHLPRRSLIHVTHLFNHWLWLCHFPAPWKEAKIIALPMPAKTQNFPKFYLRLSSCPLRANILIN